MSSALDITYKRPKRTEATVSASLLGASAYLGLAAKKLTWTNGVRYKTNRTYSDHYRLRANIGRRSSIIRLISHGNPTNVGR